MSLVSFLNFRFYECVGMLTVIPVAGVYDAIKETLKD